MTEKELKKLSRSELLEVLLVQTREVERLQEKLKKAEELLIDRRLQVLEAGDLAHAVLAVNGVMDAAQTAAQQYLDNIRIMEAETRIRCDKLLAEAKQEAERIRQEALEGTAEKENEQVTL